MIPTTQPSATREDKLAAIRAVCVAANPVIVDADEGFRIPLGEVDAGMWAYQYTAHGISRISEEHYGTQEESHAAAVTSGKFPCRRIHLADVLLAVRLYWQIQFQERDDNLLNRDRKHVCTSNDMMSVVTRWELHDDDLSFQSDRCINFLHSLLS